ncbi:MAG: hypothetical protein IKO43_01700, partial [Kiritimatiellae bacterium]|nr:hypothetical protein [Kiritimatiellia bacterium]
AYSAAVVDGASAVSSSSQIDGWDLRFGAYNGATVTWASLSKLQCDGAQWITIDGTSKLTVNGWGGGNLGQNGQSRSIEISIASQEGLVFAVDLSSGYDYGLAFNYRFAGSGSVSYQALGIASHVIKQADVTLSGSATPSVMSKTLVSFTSTTKTFTADAEIKVYASDGETLATTASLASVASGATTLTAASGVGACELVQTATGVVLYYVDGDEADIATATYKPSINVNFTSGDAPLTTAADVGLSGYAVPGTAWNNLAVANNATLTTVNAVDATGAATTVAGASVTITGTRGAYSCGSLSPATDLRHGYIDENAGNPTPTVTVEGIPYGYYRVIVYAATDAANYPFGYVSVNGTDYTYVDGELQTGTTSWGASGAHNTAEAIAEGVNTLVSDVTSGSTLTVVGHRVDGTARGCIAAIQIVEVAVSDSDLIINVSGDKTYAVDEAKSYDNVYVIGSGTLTFSGEAKITAGVLDIDRAAMVNMDASRLEPTAVTGSGAAVYSGSLPPTTLGWTDADKWNGTLWLKSVAVKGTTMQPNSLGNANSKVKFSGVTGWLEAPVVYVPEIVLENDAYDFALQLNNGNSPQNYNSNQNRVTTIGKLSGSGLLANSESGSAWPVVIVRDASGFTGSINTGTAGTSLQVGFVADGETIPESDYFTCFNTNRRSIYVSPSSSVTIASGATWTATNCVVHGTLDVQGTATFSGVAKGDGTIVYSGSLPATTMGWTDSAAWTGTLWLKNITHSGNTSGDGRNFNPKNFGNSLSTVRLTGVRCYFPNGAVTCDAKVELVDDGSTAALEVDNGYSSATYTFAELAGTGTLKGTGTGGAVHYIRVLKWSSFTGNIDMETRTVLFTTNTANSGTPWGSATTYTKGDGTIYIDAEETAVVQASGTTWKAKRFVVEGTLEANGTLATNATVTAAAAGTGKVVFTGRAPTPAGDAWWKNSIWQGTVKIADVSNMVGSGSGTVLDFNSYGNEGSCLELSNVTGWVPSGYNCTVPLKISGLTINNGSSNTTTTFSKVTGEGDLTFNFGGSNYKLVIGVLTNFTGTIYSYYASNPVQIETLELPETPESGTLLVKVGGSSYNYVTLTSVKIGQETLPAASVVKLQDGDDGYGFYFTASQLSYEIDEDTVITELEGWADDAVASIRVTGSCALTIPEGTSIGALNLTLDDGVTLSFANSGTVTLLTATGANGTLRFTSDFEIPAGFMGDATVEVADGVTLTAPYVNISSDGTTSDYAGAFTGGEGATIAMPLALSGHGDITSYENLNSLLKLNDPEGWKGTLVLSGEVGRFALKQFGNTNSTVRVDGLASDVAPWSYGADMHVVKTLEIGDGGWTLKASDYTGDQIVVPAELTGAGTLTVNATGGARIFFTGDISAFAGAVAIGSSAAVQVQFIDRADAEATTDPTTLDGCVDYAANTVAVAKGATVSIAKAWTLPNGWTGAGRIVFAAPYLVNKAVADSWTGTVELAAVAPNAQTAVWLDRMANANSVAVLHGIQPQTTNRTDEAQT